MNIFRKDKLPYYNEHLIKSVLTDPISRNKFNWLIDISSFISGLGMFLLLLYWLS